jgi:hypothetical protein
LVPARPIHIAAPAFGGGLAQFIATGGLRPGVADGGSAAVDLALPDAFFAQAELAADSARQSWTQTLPHLVGDSEGSAGADAAPWDEFFAQVGPNDTIGQQAWRQALSHLFGGLVGSGADRP